MNQQLVLDNIVLASKLARIKSFSAPPSVSFEELQSAAYMGLVDAASKFDPSMGCAFSSYARIRIEGEMKDYMRLSMFGDRIRPFLDGEDFTSTNRSLPELNLDLSRLSDKESKILHLYYLESRTMREIGVSEGVSESRISQVLSACRKKLGRSSKRRAV